MGLLGALIKLVGGQAVDTAIDTACKNLDRFVQSVQFGKDHTWEYQFFGKGSPIKIKVGVKKTRNRVYFDLPGKNFDFNVDITGKVEQGCKTAISAVLSL